MAVAESGTLDIAFAAGKVTGTVKVSPDMLNGTVSGDLVVTCWVPASELGSQAPGSGGIIEGDALLLDERMETAGCAPLRGLATP
jgi:hypothetical protein